MLSKLSYFANHQSKEVTFWSKNLNANIGYSEKYAGSTRFFRSFAFSLQYTIEPGNFLVLVFPSHNVPAKT